MEVNNKKYNSSTCRQKKERDESLKVPTKSFNKSKHDSFNYTDTGRQF